MGKKQKTQCSLLGWHERTQPRKQKCGCHGNDMAPHDSISGGQTSCQPNSSSLDSYTITMEIYECIHTPPLTKTLKLINIMHRSFNDLFTDVVASRLT